MNITHPKKIVRMQRKNIYLSRDVVSSNTYTTPDTLNILLSGILVEFYPIAAQAILGLSGSLPPPHRMVLCTYRRIWWKCTNPTILDLWDQGGRRAAVNPRIYDVGYIYPFFYLSFLYTLNFQPI